MWSLNENTSAKVELFSWNLTGNTTDGPSLMAAGVGSAVMLAFFVEGVVGTCWIMVALLRVAELRRNVVNVFVISLCINDLCTLLFVVLVIIDSYVWRRWRAGEIMCRLNPELTVAFTGSLHHHSEVSSSFIVRPARYNCAGQIVKSLFHRVSISVLNSISAESWSISTAPSVFNNSQTIPRYKYSVLENCQNSALDHGDDIRSRTGNRPSVNNVM